MNTKNVVTRATAVKFALELPEVKANAEVSAVLSALYTQLTKPRKASAKKVNPETQERRERVLSALADAGKALTCTQTAELAGVSQAQANAAIKALIESGAVKREVVKRVAMFSIAE